MPRSKGWRVSSYVEKVLQPNETVLATGHMHWIVYVRGVALILLGLICLLAPVTGSIVILLRIAGGLILLVGAVAFLRSWIRKVTTEVAVTNKRVIKKTGLVQRLTAEMNMDKVESVDVDQSILGRLLDYGTIVIRGTGSGLEGLRYIAKPLELRSAIIAK